MDDAEAYLHLLGRGKDVVNSGGYDVYPQEIENGINALDGVVESAVMAFRIPISERRWSQ